MGLKILIESSITLGLISRWTRNRMIPDKLLLIIYLLSIKLAKDNINPRLIHIDITTLKRISKLSKQKMEEVSLHKQITLVVS
jgi:hypothetical protein